MIVLSAWTATLAGIAVGAVCGWRRARRRRVRSTAGRLGRAARGLEICAHRMGRHHAADRGHPVLPRVQPVGNQQLPGGALVVIASGFTPLASFAVGA